MPASYINKVYKQNCHFLASTYPHLVAAEKQASSKDQQAPYKPLLSRRKILDDGGAPKMGKIWSEMMEELEYARSSARKAESKLARPKTRTSQY